MDDGRNYNKWYGGGGGQKTLEARPMLKETMIYFVTY
jgi:hypothetical protein